MELSPEQVRLVAEHYHEHGDDAQAIDAYRRASAMGDALSTFYLATFVRDGKIQDDATVRDEAPHALECWHNALRRETGHLKRRPVSRKQWQRVLAAYRTLAEPIKESA